MEHDRILPISDALSVPLSEIVMKAIRAQGAGGQNVNKVSTAIHLRFDIVASSALDPEQKARLLTTRDHRISKDGLVVIKAQRFRSREKNRLDALERLARVLRDGLQQAKPRKKTRTPRKAKRKRVDDKTRRGRLKESRSKRLD